MLAPLKYTADKSVKFPDSLASNVRVLGLPTLASVADPRLAIQQSLASPINFPPLSKAIVPGDRIVIAVGQHVPRCATLVAGILDYLIGNGVTAEQISILRTLHDEARGFDPRVDWDPALKSKIELITHHPTKRDEMSYLAADESAEPIYFNRALIDADLVIPLLCTEPEENSSSVRHGLLFPTFADEKSQLRASGITLENKPAKSKSTSKSKSSSKLKSTEPSPIPPQETPDMMLGLFFTIQIVPGADDEAAKILDGDTTVVTRDARQLCEELWTATIEQPAQLVVAAISPSAEQSWESVTETLVRLLPLLRPNGSLVLCNQLDVKPPEVYQQWALADMPDEVLSRIRENNVPGWQVVHRVQQGRDHARLYMLSELPPAMIDDLSWAAINEDEIVRLMQKTDNALIIHHADRVRFRMTADKTV